MLYIDFTKVKPDGKHDGYTLSWHIGEKFSRKNLPALDWGIMVQADGDELQAIRARCSNIPMHSRSVVRWTGDLARFIVDNVVCHD